MKRMVLATVITLSALLTTGGIAGAEQHSPTCSDTLDIAVHGQHVVADYVMGIDHSDLDWPPSGGIVGQTVSANGGATTPGGPGPGYHFLHGIAPGASFCNGSSSPGLHV